MKTITFKTLSILLAAVLLVAALPLSAFAEDASPCATPTCEHAETEISYTASAFYMTNEEHLITVYIKETCSKCNKVIFYDEVESWLEDHTIDPTVDQETEIQGACVDCGGTIYW